MSAAQQKTMFRSSADIYQNGEIRTKSARMNFSRNILIGGLAGVAFFGIIRLVIGKQSSLDIVLIIVWLCAALAALGVITLVIGALQPIKTVICPRCRTQHAIYRSEKKYMCPQCGTLLLMGKTETAAPQLSACPYCGLETAATADHGPFLCPDCGIVRHADAGEPWQPASQCPQCHAALPAGAIFCKACDAVLVTDFTQLPAGQPDLTYDKDWQIGKSPHGHLMFARALKAGIVAERGKVDPRQPYLEQLKKIQSLLEQLGEVMVHTEEALLAPDSAGAATGFLLELDRAYAGLLEWEAIAIGRLMANPERQRHGFEGTALTYIEAEPHMSARRRLEELLGERLAQIGSIGRWEEKLVQVQREEKVSQITDFRKLLNEANRFQIWSQQHAAQGTV